MITSQTPNSPKAAPSSTRNKETSTGGTLPDVKEKAEVDSDDEDEVLETSQNGRWQKINVQVSPFEECEITMEFPG